jgi:small subunit ribosomal protein S4
MARYCGPVCRLCRREGEKLFLKGERCFTAKCAVERREGGPGQHGRGRQQFSDFKIQLRQKQKVKRVYGLLEKGFRATFEAAAKTKGVTGTELLVNLERRLDNVAYRLGFAASRRQARQLVAHGHLLVNGKRVDIPSFLVKVGDVIEVQTKTKKNPAVVGSLEMAAGRTVPSWLSVDRTEVKGSITALPTREEIGQGFKEQLIVELYSR